MSSPGVLRFDVTTGRKGRYTSERSRVFWYVWAGETGFQHRVYAYIVCEKGPGRLKGEVAIYTYVYTRILQLVHSPPPALLLYNLGPLVRSATFYSQSTERIFYTWDIR